MNQARRSCSQTRFMVWVHGPCSGTRFRDFVHGPGPGIRSMDNARAGSWTRFRDWVQRSGLGIRFRLGPGLGLEIRFVNRFME